MVTGRATTAATATAGGSGRNGVSVDTSGDADGMTSQCTDSHQDIGSKEGQDGHGHNCNDRHHLTTASGCGCIGVDAHVHRNVGGKASHDANVRQDVSGETSQGVDDHHNDDHDDGYDNARLRPQRRQCRRRSQRRRQSKPGRTWPPGQ